MCVLLGIFALPGISQVVPCLSDSLVAADISDAGVSQGVFMTGSSWLAGQKITVKFLDGDEFVRAKVRKYAEEWEKYANVDFVFDDTAGNADIRIRFSLSGSWSLVGKKSKMYSVVKAAKDTKVVTGDREATMNYGWFRANTPEAEFRRTTLHEFGHALGLMHEHQNANRSFEWNLPVVENFYWVEYGWDKKKIHDQVLQRFGTGTELSNKTYDRLSIMHYPIPANFTTNGRGVGTNTELSAGDKALIAEMYPFRNTATSPAAAANFKFKNINVEYGVREGTENGMKITIDFDINQAKDQKHLMAAYFYTVDGKPLRDSNQKKYAANGDVAVHEYFTPKYPNAVYNKFSLFMPYSELELGCGEYKLRFAISVWKDKGVVAKSGLQYFSFWRCAASSRVDVDVDYNAEVDGKKGMKIFPKFSVRHSMGASLMAAAYFYRENGEKLADTNNAYRTSDGQVSTSANIKPCCDATDYNMGTSKDFSLFIPYDELHVPGTPRQNLKFFVRILDGKRTVIDSGWTAFYYGK